MYKLLFYVIFKQIIVVFKNDLMVNVMETFAKRLRYYREKAKYNQKELAEKIGVTFAAYNNYETKNAQPKFETLIKLAEILGTDVNTLVGFEPDDRAMLLYVLRSADIAYELDPDDKDALYIENTYFTESIYPKPDRMEGKLHIGFDDLKLIIEMTQSEVLEKTYPIFKRFFHDRITVFKFSSPYDPKDKTVWHSWVEDAEKGSIQNITLSDPNGTTPPIK